MDLKRERKAKLFTHYLSSYRICTFMPIFKLKYAITIWVTLVILVYYSMYSWSCYTVTCFYITLAQTVNKNNIKWKKKTGNYKLTPIYLYFKARKSYCIPKNTFFFYSVGVRLCSYKGYISRMICCPLCQVDEYEYLMSFMLIQICQVATIAWL